MIDLVIEHVTTADMDDGQPLPPFMDDGAIWCVVRPLPGRKTVWRRISISTQPSMAATWPRDLRLGGNEY